MTRGPRWYAIDFGMHVLNGALFGFVVGRVRRILRMDTRKLAFGMAIAEHLTLYPLCYFIDRYHPARGQPGIPALLANRAAFAQATWRHALFGLILGGLVRETPLRTETALGAAYMRLPTSPMLAKPGPLASGRDTRCRLELPRGRQDGTGRTG